MFDLIPDEILNAFSINMKIADLERKLNNKRTPKKYHEALKYEINRLKYLLEKREKTEAK